MERLGIYGGTFAPVHIGHKRAATAFLKQAELDKLLIIPAAIPPHKQLDFADSPVHRLNMCKLAFADMEKTEVSEIELERGGKSYTYDTMVSLSAPERKLFLLCGTDMILTFEEWYRYRDILNLCTLVSASRLTDKSSEEKTAKILNHFKKDYGAEIMTLDYTPFEISSTDIREMLIQNKDISQMIDKKVCDYIYKNNLYNACQCADKTSFNRGI